MNSVRYAVAGLMALFMASAVSGEADAAGRSYGVGLDPIMPPIVGSPLISGKLSGNGQVSLLSFSEELSFFSGNSNAIYTKESGLIVYNEYQDSFWSSSSLSFSGDRFISHYRSLTGEGQGLQMYEIEKSGNVRLENFIPFDDLPNYPSFNTFAVVGENASPMLYTGSLLSGDSEIHVYTGNEFLFLDSLRNEEEMTLNRYVLYEGGGLKNIVYFTRGYGFSDFTPKESHSIYSYDGDALVKTNIDLTQFDAMSSSLGTASLYEVDQPISPNGRFVLFRLFDGETLGVLGVYDFQTGSYHQFKPESLSDFGITFYTNYRITSNGMIFAKTHLVLDDYWGSTSVVIAPDGKVQLIEDYLKERMPKTGSGVTSEALDAIGIYEVLDFSDDGLRLLVKGKDTDGEWDAFIIDLLTGSFLSISELRLISNAELRSFIESGSASPELIALFREATDAEIAEYGRGLSSILPAAVSNVLNNALSHTFNLNARFDTLHRESISRFENNRDSDGLGFYAYTTAVIREYESNVSDIRGQTESYGGMLVVDQKIRNGFYVGAGIGVKTDESDFNSGAELDSETYAASLYASSKFFDHLYLDLLFQYADVRMDSERRSLDLLTAEPEATACGSEIRASYYFEKADFLLAPKLSLSYNHLKFDAYSESGGLSAASVDGFDVDSLRMGVGFQAQYVFELAQRPLIGSLQVDWNHEFIDEGEVVDAVAAGANFGTRTDDPDVDSGLVSLGFNYLLSDAANLYAEYSKNFGNSLNDDHIIRLGLGYSF